jgi:hypothetical protein
MDDTAMALAANTLIESGGGLAWENCAFPTGAWWN